MLYGVDYYADMFERVTSLELNVMENTWGRSQDCSTDKTVPTVLTDSLLSSWQEI